MNITAMSNPPNEVERIVRETTATHCDSGNYESLTPICWIKASNLFEARRVLDRYYQIVTETTSTGRRYTRRLADSVADLSRGDPVELHVGDWWILCGFNFD